MLRKIFWVLVKIVAAIGLCVSGGGLLIIQTLGRMEGAGAYAFQFIGGSAMGIGAIFLAVASVAFLFRRAS